MCRAALILAAVLAVAAAVRAAPGTAITFASKPAETVVVAVAGDIACDPSNASYRDGLGSASACRQRPTSDLLLDTKLFPRLDAVLTVGDNQYEDGSLAKYESSYAASWGRPELKALTRPAPGNHEYGTPGAAGYFAYFGAAAGEPGRGYYSFDLGAWHLVALNSNCGAVGGCGRGSPQVRWLRADLAASKARCTLAYWHHPRFSSGLHGSSRALDALWRALFRANADVVLAGHDHHYERFAPQDPNGRRDPKRGLRQFVVGTGGRSLYPMVIPVANSQVRESETYGVLQLTLRPRGYSWRFVPEAGATFADSGSSACH